jgi:hypothetical protein
MKKPNPSFYWRVVNFFATTKHKAWVMWFILKACWALIKRGIKHDLSKYSRHEAPYFASLLKELKYTTYGTPEYKEMLGRIRPAIEHHQNNNSHHPEYYIGLVSAMSPLDLVEMICDWKAATLRHVDGNIITSIEYNKKRFKYNLKQQDSLTRDALEIGLL